mmetsp:Transcript_27696/g.51635  ORF Transcript_27696/g.51635 Transcript_27696/m.51635 type:complete len:84 (+) Transcript_27696:525-776(+)
MKQKLPKTEKDFARKQMKIIVATWLLKQNQPRQRNHQEDDANDERLAKRVTFAIKFWVRRIMRASRALCYCRMLGSHHLRIHT